MLRAKQIGPISQCARSFLISGSRSGKADGSSCTSSEDETCIPRRQQKDRERLLPQKSSAFVSKTSVRAGPIFTGDVNGTSVYEKVESGIHPTLVAHVLSRPVSSHISNGVVVNNGEVHPALNTDQFVKTSSAREDYLTDIVSYKLADSDGSRASPFIKNQEVDSTRSTQNIVSSNSKSRRGANFSKVHGRQPIRVSGGFDSNSSYHDPTFNCENPGSVRSLDHLSCNSIDNSVGSYDTITEAQYQRQPASQRSKPSSHISVSKSKSGIRCVSNVQKPPKSTITSTQTAPAVRQSNNDSQVVEYVHHTLKQLKWSPAAEEVLENLNCSLGVYQANQILKQLQDHSVAHNFFYWLKQKPGFKHDEYTYTTIIGILGRARQFSAISRLLDEMVRDGCSPNVVTYNRLIYSYGHANYLDKAMDVFYKMQEMGCKPDRVTYCTLIDVHAKAGFLDVSMDMYQRMHEAGLSPDTFTYSVMINCLGKAGHLADAYHLFCEMVAEGCVPSRVTFNIMIALQAKARNYACALELYRDMQAVGFEPDKVTYSIVMEALGHCGHLEEAESLFQLMKSKNWVPDEPVYGLLVDLWGKSGNVDRAQAWYYAMLDAGLCPNVPICNSLLSAFLRVHRFSDAYNVLKSMSGLGLCPSLQTYTLLLSSCSESQSLTGMSFCRELMGITGHPAHAFLLSMPAAGPDGQNVRDHVGNFLDLMHSEDRESKRGLVDAVIDFLHKSGLKEEAGSMWEVAAERSIYPDVIREKSSCYWLINLHVMSDGTAVTALSRTLAWFRKQILASGIGPNRIDIVTGWGRRSRVTGSSQVRESIKDLLLLFQFPFFTENGNSGCFVGCGEALNRWLLQSFIERMHLL